MSDYAGLVEYIVRNMVDHPDAVVVEALPGRGRAQTIEISLDPEDVGRVIGKGGRNIEAIRAVVKAASIKDHERVNVEVIADELPRPEAEAGSDRGVEPSAVDVDEAAAEPAGGEVAAALPDEPEPLPAPEGPVDEAERDAGE
jgi:predicted RNA-binding protein YlqC (UPF0109 family)